MRKVFRIFGLIFEWLMYVKSRQEYKRQQVAQKIINEFSNK